MRVASKGVRLFVMVCPLSHEASPGIFKGVHLGATGLGWFRATGFELPGLGFMGPLW